MKLVAVLMVVVACAAGLEVSPGSPSGLQQRTPQPNRPRNDYGERFAGVLDTPGVQQYSRLPGDRFGSSGGSILADLSNSMVLNLLLVGVLFGISLLLFLAAAFLNSNANMSGRGLDTDDWEVDHSVWMDQLRKDFEVLW